MRRLVTLLLIAIAVPAAAGPHDPKATVADVFAFRSYAPASANRVTLVMTVDSLLDPGVDPERALFDPAVRYEIRVDNDNDAIADLVFRFTFVTQTRSPDLPFGHAGVGSGADAPANSPSPVAPGTEIVPPRVRRLPGAGLGVRQYYTAVMVKGGVVTPLVNDARLFAVPPHTGPRTMDDAALFAAGVQSVSNGIRLFAGRVDDPSFGDLGGLYDTLNFAKSPPILSAAEDAALVNLAADTRSGSSVNAIAIEVPIALLTRTGAIEPATSTAATIGVWAVTLRRETTVLRSPDPPAVSGPFVRVARRGHPWFTELLVRNADKQAFRLGHARDDDAFLPSVLDPMIARMFNALTAGAVAIPAPPRLDLLPLVTYAPPVAAAGTAAGPTADVLRLNTGVAPTPEADMNRLGLLGGDPAGYPNGRRPGDDVLDVVLRLVVGGVLAGPPFSNNPINDRLGDGVNVNDAPFATSFPYMAPAPAGRNRRHVDPGEPACTPVFGGGAACLP
jgi:hypothetical protein